MILFFQHSKNPKYPGDWRTELAVGSEVDALLGGSRFRATVIDATRPATLPFETRIVPPKEAWDRIRLEDYIDGA